MLNIRRITIICWLCGSGISYPQFHNDYKVSKVVLDPLSQEIAKSLAPVDDEMPFPCRSDVCYAATTESPKQGIFLWPEIRVGHKVELRCPFSFEVPLYAIRICGINKDNETAWQRPEYQNICPHPPLAELLYKITDELADHSGSDKETFYRSIITRIVEVLTVYWGTPISSSDVIKLLDIYTEVLYYHVEVRQEMISTDTARDMLFILNALMEDDNSKHYLSMQVKRNNRKQLVSDLLEKLPYRIARTQGRDLDIVLSNIAIHVRDVSKENEGIIQISNGFTFKLDSGETVYSPNVSLHILDKIANYTGDAFSIGVTLIKDSNIRVSRYSWYMYTYNTLSTSAYGLTSSRFSTTQQFIETTVPAVISTAARNDDMNTSTSTNFSATVDSTQPKYNTIPSLSINPFTKKRINVIMTAGSTIFVTTSLPNSSHLIKDVIKVSYDYFTCENRSNCMTDQVCVKADDGGFSDWSNLGCETIDNQVQSGYISCRCSGLGAFGVFYERRQGVPIDPGGAGDPKVEDGAADVSVFLGFPYRKELEILGNVLGAISLACLVATMASYIIFRKKHMSTPTKILLNLCVALITLSVLLFGIYFAADVMNVTGCTVSNVLRYYLIFVTLVWNGIEAFNMYMMLVKIFGREISKFVLKAGIVAWGLPALMVGVCFSVNQKTFKGQYVLISEEEGTCTFKCQLRSGTLYFAYLIPLAIIIVHNLVMFAFVLRAILKHGSKLGKAQKKSRLVQLSGVFGTLVLLGVPWIFSVFGAIDSTTSDELAMAEGVFQVIFVVFVNLQGLFIFLFHCARNAQMRASWSSVVKRSTFRTKTTSGLSSTDSQSTKSSVNTVNKNVKEFDKI